MGPIPRANDQPEKYRLTRGRHGPYMFDQYTPEKTLTLVRKPALDPTPTRAARSNPEKYVMDSRRTTPRSTRSC